MKNILYYLLTLILISSCQKSRRTYELDAIKHVANILKQAEETILNDPKVLLLQEFDNMDSIKFKEIYGEIITVTAECYYVADIATHLTPDCLTQPSDLETNSPVFEDAIRDSVYHTVLIDKLATLRESNEKKLDYFSRKDFLVFQEKLKRISKELRGFCSEEVIENLEDWRSTLPKNYKE